MLRNNSLLLIYIYLHLRNPIFYFYLNLYKNYVPFLDDHLKSFVVNMK